MSHPKEEDIESLEDSETDDGSSQGSSIKDVFEGQETIILDLREVKKYPIWNNVTNGRTRKIKKKRRSRSRKAESVDSKSFSEGSIQPQLPTEMKEEFYDAHDDSFHVVPENAALIIANSHLHEVNEETLLKQVTSTPNSTIQALLTGEAGQSETLKTTSVVSKPFTGPE